ncbi:NAD(P)/FAD-dependent oxidoreductase [Nocardiopsis ansamitocini]|uniref:Oxidoreductase n=1 Tax=Nocardiopsis ansamitocini TaxID=1670832 RepID=A0A9W6PB85_9ACTN|nr:FAD-dependent oxidoreductase [Nocardiopsis ansamitocini]GLU50332.1 oxidoreductase [Nocardiopsis ansamitocini]
MNDTTDVAIVGGGPSGLAAAIALRNAGVARVSVVDRESAMGGIPRHCAHPGYGIRDLHRVLSGPGYARHYVQAARRAGVHLRTESTVTGWAPGAGLGLEVTSPGGREVLHADAVLLASGARERNRSARWVPGDRGAGVYTTGQLQQEVYFYRRPIGRRALVVGAEHVSYSAVATLRHAGVSVVGLVTELSRQQSYAVFHLGAAAAFGVRPMTGVRVRALHGKPRLSGVELERLDDGRRVVVDCDTVVFTGDWIADNELARLHDGIDVASAALGPVVDTSGATSMPGVFAAGNLCHPVEQADIAALSGRHAGQAVARWLVERDTRVAQAGVPIETDASLEWVHPGRVRSTGDLPARGRFILRPNRFAAFTALRVTQGERTLWHGRGRRLTPTRPTLIPAGWLRAVDLNGPALRIGVGD